MTSLPTGAGRTSFDFLDSDAFFEALDLLPGDRIADLGCGAGSYTFPLAAATGDAGTVFALDAWEEGIERVKERAENQGVVNIEAIVADAGAKLPLADASIDLFFMATVFHDFVADGIADNVMREVSRTLGPGGTVALIEFALIESDGPPLHVRLAPDDCDALWAPHGFTRCALEPVGGVLYLACYRKEEK